VLRDYGPTDLPLKMKMPANTMSTVVEVNRRSGVNLDETKHSAMVSEGAVPRVATAQFGDRLSSTLLPVSRLATS
jgi:hypothetical protein